MKYFKYKNKMKINEKNFYNYIIKKQDSTKNIRNPGIDIIRLISIFGVIINHILYAYGGLKKYPQHSKRLKILHIVTGWHIDGFALISGIVGYKACKYYNLFYSWFSIVFYSYGIYLYFYIIKKRDFIKDDISKYYLPIIFQRYWYFTAYFGMYLFLPIINKGISQLTRFEFSLVIYSTLFLFVFLKSTKNPGKDVFLMNQGNSMIWLLTYYIIGAYIGKYRVNYFGYKKYFFCLIYSLIFIFSTYLFFKLYLNELYFGNGYLNNYILSILKPMFVDRYDGVVKVVQSISASLFFLQIHYNYYIAKIICFLGPLTFGIYLIHMNTLVNSNILKYTFNNEKSEISLISAKIIIIIKSMKIFFLCIVIDFFRNLLFSVLKLKKICIFLEIEMKKLLNYIIFI